MRKVLFWVISIAIVIGLPILIITSYLKHKYEYQGKVCSEIIMDVKTTPYDLEYAKTHNIYIVVDDVQFTFKYIDINNKIQEGTYIHQQKRQNNHNFILDKNKIITKLYDNNQFFLDTDECYCSLVGWIMLIVVIIIVSGIFIGNVLAKDSHCYKYCKCEHCEDDCLCKLYYGKINPNSSWSKFWN